MFVQRLKDHSHSPYDPEPVLETFGEVQQIWHLWRRRYDLFLRSEIYLRDNFHTHLTFFYTSGQLQGELFDNTEPQTSQSSQSIYHQIAKVDAEFLAFNFIVQNEQELEIARIERAFRGFGREVGLNKLDTLAGLTKAMT